HTREGIRFKTDNGSPENLLSELKIVLDVPVSLEACGSEEMQRYLSANYRQSASPSGNRLNYTSDFLERILLGAKNIGSSDIHFEPYEKRCRIRFRLDGKLIEQFNVPVEEYPTIINKIKIRA